MADSDKSDEEFLLLYLLYRRHRARIKRKYWVHDIFRRRSQLGEYHQLLRELSSHEDKFFKYFRMSESQFQQILGLVKEDIEKEQTFCWMLLGAQERQAISLR